MYHPYAYSRMILLQCRGLFLKSLANLFGPIKPFLVHLHLKMEKYILPKTSCMKGSSVHIKNMQIKQLCNRDVRDFAMALQAGKVYGAFEELAPGPGKHLCFYAMINSKLNLASQQNPLMASLQHTTSQQK